MVNRKFHDCQVNFLKLDIMWLKIWSGEKIDPYMKLSLIIFSTKIGPVHWKTGMEA